jgi:hypothetical protein
MNKKLIEFNMSSKGSNIKLNLMVLIVQIMLITNKKDKEKTLINKWQTFKNSLILKQIYLMNKILLIMLSIN